MKDLGYFFSKTAVLEKKGSTTFSNIYVYGKKTILRKIHSLQLLTFPFCNTSCLAASLIQWLSLNTFRQATGIFRRKE